MSDERVEFELLGQRYTIRSEASTDYVLKLVEYLEETLRALDQSGQMKEPAKLFMLAALHVTDELFRAREQSAQLPPKMGERIQKLVKLLDDAVPLSS
ncbi:MAG TPA: cell division protein ZapA [Methylomirabilota bacterium]|nr:cell division protein ZapA [Methylomirabilota bacterium]